MLCFYMEASVPASAPRLCTILIMLFMQMDIYLSNAFRRLITKSKNAFVDIEYFLDNIQFKVTEFMALTNEGPLLHTVWT